MNKPNAADAAALAGAALLLQLHVYYQPDLLAGLRHIYRPGYLFQKTGVMLSGLSSRFDCTQIR